MVKLGNSFSRLIKKNILVVGDFILDSYTIGKVHRVSPEAPVPILNVTKKEDRAGGAGNTALNLRTLGADVRTLGRIGEDAQGQILLKTLNVQGIDCSGIFEDKEFITPHKTRIVAANQQIVRIDHEFNTLLKSDLEETIIARLPELLKGIDVVAISDYGKGFLTPQLLKALITTAKQRSIFVIADPKGTDFSRYNGVDLIKPNLSEAYAAANLPTNASLTDVSEKILNSMNTKYLLITRSEDGISLFEKNKPRFDFPVEVKQVKDVTGAGDTVLSMLAFAVANEIDIGEAIEFSNVAAGIAIEQFGCAQVTLPQIAQKLLSKQIENKIFDKSHLNVLQTALGNTLCHFLPLSGNEFPTYDIIASLIKRKQETGEAILAMIDGHTYNPNIIESLAALQPIDYVLINQIKP